MTISAKDVLDILDGLAADLVFPMLDNGYVYPAAARLSLFRSEVDWAMVFETFGYSPRYGLPNLSVTTIGSRVRHGQLLGYDEATRRAYVENNPTIASEHFDPMTDGDWLDDEHPEVIAPGATAYHLREQSYPMPGATDYDAAGIVAAEPPVVLIYEFARAVAHLHRDLVLATPDERRSCLPGPMVCLSTLDDWRHPDVGGRVLPSQEACFRDLAEVIAAGNVRAYRPVSGNTHWSNWPDGGTL